MSTKISASIKAVLRDGDETALVLVLEKPYTVSLEKNDSVYIELTNAMNGDKLSFFPAPPEVQSDDKEEGEDYDQDLLTPTEIEKGVLPPVEIPVVTDSPDAAPEPVDSTPEPTSPEQPEINENPPAPSEEEQ